MLAFPIYSGFLFSTPIIIIINIPLIPPHMSKTGTKIRLEMKMRSRC